MFPSNFSASFQFPITAIREIKLLKVLKDRPNIVQLRDVVSSPGSYVSLAFSVVVVAIAKQKQ